MVRQQRFHRGEQVAARNLERAITMRRERFVGWARSAASALRGMLPGHSNPKISHTGR